jgi:murein L,D-transpeptidase YafK
MDFRHLFGLFAAVVVAAPLPAGAEPRAPGVAAGGFAAKQLRHPRVREAADARLAAVEQSFRDVGAAWPPRGIFIRGFKTEGEVELWAATRDVDAAWVRVRSFPVCARSGALGPKRRQGDLQVPEGFYHVSVFNPWSDFHLSLGVSYPNAADRFHSRGVPPGNAIMVHGNCVTIGCLPLEDGPIEDLYLAAVMARDAGQATIPIHLFPCRFGEQACEDTLAAAAAERPDLEAFWAGLRPGHAAFAETGRPPVMRANRDGTYTLLPARKPRRAS